MVRAGQALAALKIFKPLAYFFHCAGDLVAQD
jgi:hypothetical protein